MPDGAVARHGPCVASSDRKRLYSAYATRRGGARLKLGLVIPNFTWPGGPPRLGADLAAVAQAADAAGFEWIGVMDHLFQIPAFGPPELDMLEAYTTLGYLAAHTSRAQLLTIVTAAIYRHPGMLAKIVTTLDVLSGGRAWLGIGAAWNEQEARGLDLPFPPVATRFERLEETLQICLQMWRGDAGPYQGTHYQLERPLNVPQSLSRPHPPILIGGSGERKTLRLVARYAQACNLLCAPEEVPHKLAVLRAHCANEGRNYDEILKTCMVQIDVGANGEGVGAVIEQLRGLAGMGIQGALCEVKDVWRITPLEIIGREIIPAVGEW